MARIMRVQEFEMVYQILFGTNIRGHHVYKDIWNPTLSEFLNVKFDTREDARDYDKHALGIYADETLVGHVPIELSSLLHFFLEADEQNRLICQVIGKRKREVGLVVPAKFFAFSKNKRLAETLGREMKKRKELLTYFELTYEPEFVKIMKFPWFMKDKK